MRFPLNNSVLSNVRNGSFLRRYVTGGESDKYVPDYTWKFPNLIQNSIITVFLGAIVYNVWSDGSPLPYKQTEGQTSAVQRGDIQEKPIVKRDTQDFSKRENWVFVQLYQKGQPLPFKNEIIGQTITEEELEKMVKKFGYTVTYPEGYLPRK